MEQGGRDIVVVPLEGVDALLRLVVPDLDESVVGAGDDVGLVAAEVVDAVDALLVPRQREVCLRGSGGERPDLDRAVE